MLEPERVVQIALGWWDYQLKGDPAARDMFEGPSCGLCTGANFGQGNVEYGSNANLNWPIQLRSGLALHTC